MAQWLTGLRWEGVEGAGVLELVLPEAEAFGVVEGVFEVVESGWRMPDASTEG